MANVEGYELPDELYYHREHMWARVEDGKVVVGITDFAQKLAGDISFVDMPEEGDEVEQDERVGTIETGKWLGKLYAPVSGEVTARNEAVEDDPTVINRDPYGEGWIFEIEMSAPEELKNLLHGEAAVEWLKGEIEKHAK
jgi:glycine cleavage system H protein